MQDRDGKLRIIDIAVTMTLFISGCITSKFFIERVEDTWFMFNGPALSVLVIGEMIWWKIRKKIIAGWDSQKRGKEGIYNKYIKRVLDVICSLCALILFSWLFLLIAILVKLKLGSPVIFTTERPGRIDPKTGEEKLFKLYKFRTMTNAKDENGELLPDSKRLTHFGRSLRALSIDEIPEFFNILKGDMSLIGPRPLAVVYLPYYTQEEHHRHDVRPGLTGWAQVNGRNSISWEDKFKFDLQYTEEMSLLFDVKILLFTIKKVFIREGIGQGENQPESLHILRKKAR